MEERRRADRLKKDNEITITVISSGVNPPKEKIIYNLSKDISVSGARIQVNGFLPVDTRLNINFKFEKPPKTITVLGKVKWIKSLFADEFFEAGLEFINTSREMI
jgi:hypothetical protein